MPIQWIITGLGNPGKQYEATRHNVGFLTVDLLAARWGIKLKKLKFQSLYAEHNGVLLQKPQTFMNLSGRAVREAAQFYKVPPERVIVIYDDVSLPPGRLRIRINGSDGGHNGIKDILYQIQTDTFCRVRIGVGAKPRADMDLADWVLSGFSAAEQKMMLQVFSSAADAAEHILKYGAQSAMNAFNAEPKSQEQPKSGHGPEGEPST